MAEPRTAPEETQRDARSWIAARLVTLARVYFTWVFGWTIAHALLGTRLWWLFVLSTFAEYLFLTLPVIAGIALLVRRRETWIGLGAVAALGLYLYGGLFLPRMPQGNPNGATLSAMSYNLCGTDEHPEGVVGTIRAVGADVIALQELTPSSAEAIQRELTAAYPYQVLNPQVGVTGMGVISRYPLRPSGETLPGNWVFVPQVLAMDFAGSTVTVLHFHTFATSLSRAMDLRAAPAHIERTVRERERQAQEVADFVATHPGPLIAPTDLNTGDQSTTYALITDVLADSWREAGWGLGHTFPGIAPSDGPGATFARLPIPMWWIRIDYVFHSAHWRALDAWVGPWDGVSDHRPVVTQLMLVQE
jgi:vancomycin resistance protein VanJ